LRQKGQRKKESEKGHKASGRNDSRKKRQTVKTTERKSGSGNSGTRKNGKQKTPKVGKTAKWQNGQKAHRHTIQTSPAEKTDIKHAPISHPL
jgi:hypothetical protein